MSNLKLGSLNINGARDHRKRAVLFDLVKQKNIVVMFVQETYTDMQNENAWKMELEREVFKSHKTNIRQGFALSSMLYASAIEPFLVRIRAKIDSLEYTKM